MDGNESKGNQIEMEANPKPHANTFGSYFHLDPDKVLTAYGRFGRYQMFSYFVTTIVMLLYCMNMMVMPFITEDIDFHCKIPNPDNRALIYTQPDKCTILDGNGWKIRCNDIPGATYEYNTTIHGSLTSQFDLVCDEFESTEHSSSIYLFGGMIASPIVTQMSDIFGRRRMFLWPLYLSVVSNLAAAFVPNYTLFLVLRFFAGFGTMGFVSTAFTLSTESVSTAFRDFLPFLPTLIWVIGYMMAGLLKLWIENWRMLYFAVSAPGIFLIPLTWFTPESIHWLITNRKHSEVKKYIKTASRINKIELVLAECKDDSRRETLTEAPKRTILDIFRHKGLLLQMFLNALVYTVMNATYWGLSLFSTDLSENKMTGFFLSGLIELPAGLLGIFFMYYFPRRFVSCGALMMQGVALVCAAYLPGSPHFLLVFALAAKFMNCIAWGINPLMVSEMAPTTVRNGFVGLASFIGDVGSVLAPYLKRLEAIHPSAPSLLLAASSVLAGFCVLLMPETKDKKMPDDLDNFDAGPLRKYLGCLKEEKIPPATGNGEVALLEERHDMGEASKSRSLNFTLEELLGLTPEPNDKSPRTIRAENSNRPPTRHGRDSVGNLLHDAPARYEEPEVVAPEPEDEAFDTEEDFVSKLNALRRRSLVSTKLPGDRPDARRRLESMPESPTTSVDLRPTSKSSKSGSTKSNASENTYNISAGNGHSRPKTAAPRPEFTSVTSKYHQPGPEQSSAAYESWMRKKRAESRRKREEERKREERARKEAEDKKKNAEKVFERWKRTNDERIAEQRRQEERKRRKAQEKAAQVLKMKKSEAEKAYDAWKRAYDENLEKNKRGAHVSKLAKERAEQEDKDEQRANATAAFEAWTEAKEEEEIEAKKKAQALKEEEKRKNIIVKEYKEMLANQSYDVWLQMKGEELAWSRLNRDMEDTHLYERVIPWVPPSNTVARRRSPSGQPRRRSLEPRQRAASATSLRAPFADRLGPIPIPRPPVRRTQSAHKTRPSTASRIIKS
ncbi:unnamed protein product, partial [Mesorhabditis spiculigera]